MTKILLIINAEEGIIHFECLDHSEDHDTCTIVSTLCNVLFAECERIGVAPKLNGPSVKINITDPGSETIEVFQVVQKVLEECYKQNKRYMKLY